MDKAIQRRGFMFVLSSPSGAGKTTLSRMLLQQDDNLVMSVSTTTRPMRPGEVDGHDYNFVDKPTFSTMVQQQEFLEHAEVFGNHYGTPVKLVDDKLDQGTDVLFDIDWQGTEQLAALRPDDLVSVFILPPTMAELEKRLRSRASDSEEVIASRMDKAGREISQWGKYNYVIINRDLEESLEQVRSILTSERCRRVRQQGLGDFVGDLLSQ